jgi:hypothetical protein
MYKQRRCSEEEKQETMEEDAIGSTQGAAQRVCGGVG